MLLIVKNIAAVTCAWVRSYYTFKCNKCGIAEEYVINLPEHLRGCNIYLLNGDPKNGCDGKLELISTRIEPIRDK